MKKLFNLKAVFVYFSMLVPMLSFAKGLGSLGAEIAIQAAKPVAVATAKAGGKVAVATAKAGAQQVPKVVKFSTKNLTAQQRAIWNAIPKTAGTYRFIDSSGKVYIGKSVDIHRRMGEHLRTGKLLPNGLANVEYRQITSIPTRQLSADQVTVAKGIIGTQESVRANATAIIDGRSSLSNVQMPSTVGTMKKANEILGNNPNAANAF